ncbi:hypothetical protein K438DRAFT_1990415 [Mycena galopus ATCC 62051]|nr:hypothetical protein K438DRAFT_1990415 [Mycena galopus ATCC 62051]
MADLNAIENALSALTATVQQLAAATLPPAEQLLSEKWSSYIHDYPSIASNLGVICPSAAVIARLMGGLSFTVDPSEILRSFLKWSGLSCHVQFNKAKAAFHPIVPSQKSTPPRSALRCSHGHAQAALYHPETIQRETGMANGTIVFRSCVRSARIPRPFLIGLHRASYPVLDDSGMPTPPLTLQDAIDDWLLTEILGSIRDFSIL